MEMAITDSVTVMPYSTSGFYLPAADKSERFKMWEILVCCLRYPPFFSGSACHLFLLSDETGGYNCLQA